MAGEGAPNCAQIQKKKKTLQSGMGGVWKPRIHNSPAPPARAGGPTALATVPSRMHVLCARAATPRVPADVRAAQARPEGVSQHGHFPRRHLQYSALAWTPIAGIGQGTELVLK